MQTCVMLFTSAMQQQFNNQQQCWLLQ